jgi:hypothetical protein
MTRTALLSVGALALVALPAWALPHLRLLKSAPLANAVEATSPTAISLWLSETPEPAASKITLTHGKTPIALSAIVRDTAKGTPLIAKIPKPLAKGAYTVTWKAMSKDGHVVNGTYTFRVGTATND